MIIGCSKGNIRLFDTKNNTIIKQSKISDD